MNDVLIVAVPLFVLLMVVEFAWSRARGLPAYRFADTLASLGQGILSQLVGACATFLTIGIYSLVEERIALVHADDFWSGIAGILLAVVLYDFLDYWLHRVSHRSALFWAAHVVHHQSEEFNLSTALRQESLYPILGFPFFLPMALLGIPPATFAIAGIVVLFYQFWIHTTLVQRLGWFDLVFSSPSNHRVHHAVNDEYIDRNYGAILIVWDRMFGTFAPERAPCTYGTRAPLRSWDPLRALVQVFAATGREALRTRSWLDRVRIWFLPPEWRPADLAAAEPAPAFDISAFRRFDPPRSRAATVGATVQFLLVAIAAGLVLGYEEVLAWRTLVLATILVAGALWVMGRLLEGRMGLLRAVAIDVLLLLPAAAAFAQPGAVLPHVEVRQAWVRGTVEGQEGTGAYMVLRSDADAAVTGVRTSLSPRAGLHAMRMHGNAMTMEPLARIELPARQDVVLDERGMHIMIAGLTRAVRADERVHLWLRIAGRDGTQGEIEVEAGVRPLGAPAPH